MPTPSVHGLRNDDSDDHDLDHDHDCDHDNDHDHIFDDDNDNDVAVSAQSRWISLFCAPTAVVSSVS